MNSDITEVIILAINSNYKHAKWDVGDYLFDPKRYWSLYIEGFRHIVNGKEIEIDIDLKWTETPDNNDISITKFEVFYFDEGEQFKPGFSFEKFKIKNIL